MSTTSNDVIKCRFHGPRCEDVERCMREKPRKYAGDGNLEDIDPERLQVGHVLRSNDRSGRLDAFSDSIVLAIFRVDRDGKAERYDTYIQAARARTQKAGHILVRLARPYVYEQLGGPLLGCETFDHDLRILNTHKVVVMSTGEYDRRSL